MSEKRTDYSKAKTKSTPVGIRFNLLQEKEALQRSGKKTRQQLVDFLLDNYVNGVNPIFERMAKREGELVGIATKVVVEALKDFTKPTNQVMPITEPKPASNYEVKIEPKPISSVLDNFDALQDEILATSTIPELETVMKKVKSALLTNKQRFSLEQIAKEHSVNFYTD